MHDNPDVRWNIIIMSLLYTFVSNSMYLTAREDSEAEIILCDYV